MVDVDKKENDNEFVFKIDDHYQDILTDNNNEISSNLLVITDSLDNVSLATYNSSEASQILRDGSGSIDSLDVSNQTEEDSETYTLLATQKSSLNIACTNARSVVQNCLLYTSDAADE